MPKVHLMHKQMPVLQTSFNKHDIVTTTHHRELLALDCTVLYFIRIGDHFMMIWDNYMLKYHLPATQLCAKVLRVFLQYKEYISLMCFDV